MDIIKHLDEYFIDTKDTYKDLSEDEYLKLYTDNSLIIFENRYYLNRYDAKINDIRKEQNPLEVYRRISTCIISAITITIDEIINREYLKHKKLLPDGSDTLSLEDFSIMYFKDNKIMNRIHNIHNSIYLDMKNKRFLFNSPVIFNSAIEETLSETLSYIIYDKVIEEYEYSDYVNIYKNRSKYQNLFACFVIPVNDSMEDIMASVANMATISKYGGGVGASFGKLREKNAIINNGIAGKSSGPLSFMKIWNTTAEAVMQGGKRRAALMGILPIHHPDIEAFIDAKKQDGEYRYFNFSVAIDDKFMSAVKNDTTYDLISPSSGEIIKTVNAVDLFRKISSNAWSNGDPGVFFIDTANKDNILKKDNKWYINSTNPCGEIATAENSSCNLGSINLETFITKDSIHDPYNEIDTFDYEELKKQVIRSTVYLDLVTDATTYPIKEIEENTKQIRQIGLGFMGLANTSIKNGFKYGDENFYEMFNKIASIFGTYSLISSINMVSEWNFKPFPVRNIIKELFDDNDITNIPKSIKTTMEELKNVVDPSKYQELINALSKGNMRNSKRLSIAPTGTLSMLFDTSSGIEPNFAYVYKRRINDGTDIYGKELWKVLRYYHPHLNEIDIKHFEEKAVFDEDQNLVVMGDLPNDNFVSTMDISIENHILPVDIFAKYVANGISKTFNFSNNATIEDIELLYIDAYNRGIKGVTVYRDNSRENQPIFTASKPIEIESKDIKKFPYDIPNSDRVRKRPELELGLRRKESTPYGSLYVGVYYDDDGKVFETFIDLGKSGTTMGTLVEALSRVISISIRSGVNIDDILSTIRYISENDIWGRESIDGNDEKVRSLPDHISAIIADIINHSDKIYTFSNNKEEKEIYPIKTEKDVAKMLPEAIKNIIRKDICPECGSKMMMIDGCPKCSICGYSKCG